MVNINICIKSLKITWLKRVVHNSKNISWYSLSCIDYQKLFSFEMGYAKSLRQNLQNPFWKDVLQNWAEFCKEVKTESIKQILDSPLWYNQNLSNGLDFCIRDRHDKGIVLVSDIIDDEGNLYKFEALKTKYNLRGTNLDFRAFIRRLPEYWKNKINDNRIACFLSKHDVRCNLYLQYLMRDKKGIKLRDFQFKITNKILVTKSFFI